MFVPSLSWKMFVFICKWLKQTGFTYKDVDAVWRLMRVLKDMATVAVPLLSRACRRAD
jgi:hypothetical protein